jgi:hypothetical protein
MLNEYQKSKIASLSEEKRKFIEKQLLVFKGQGFMDGDMFLPSDGKCYYCGKDVIDYEISNGNDGSKSVTGCHFCHKSYCE